MHGKRGIMLLLDCSVLNVSLASALKRSLGLVFFMAPCGRARHDGVAFLFSLNYQYFQLSSSAFSRRIRFAYGAVVLFASPPFRRLYMA